MLCGKISVEISMHDLQVLLVVVQCDGGHVGRIAGGIRAWHGASLGTAGGSVAGSRVVRGDGEGRVAVSISAAAGAFKRELDSDGVGLHTKATLASRSASSPALGLKLLSPDESKVSSWRDVAATA